MGDSSVLVAAISAVALILSGVLVEMVRGRHKSTSLLESFDRRLLIIEIVLGLNHDVKAAVMRNVERMQENGR